MKRQYDRIERPHRQTPPWLILATSGLIILQVGEVHFRAEKIPHPIDMRSNFRQQLEVFFQGRTDFLVLIQPEIDDREVVPKQPDSLKGLENVAWEDEARHVTPSLEVAIQLALFPLLETRRTFIVGRKQEPIASGLIDGKSPIKEVRA